MSPLSGFDRLWATFDPASHVRGRQFEQLTAWFLGHDPFYKNLFRKVWSYKDWPGYWGPDAGIDLVAESRATGELWAIQCKAYSPNYRITKADVDTFLSESSRTAISHRLLVATTDLIGSTALRTIKAQEKPVHQILRNDLRSADVFWPHHIDKLSAIPKLPDMPRPHQEQAIQDVAAALADGGRAQLRMACGTGKTMVGLHTAQTLGSQRTLVLVPSLALLSQTLMSWVTNSPEPINWLAVCSDDTTVAHDSLKQHVSDLGFPTTTDPRQIAEFLSAPEPSSQRVVFATYQSGQRIVEAHQSGAPAFDLVIADEAHRCAGRKAGLYGIVLADDQILARSRLFMTATPRYVSARVKKAATRADDEVEVVSMDDVETFGRVAHTLTFRHAIRLKLLSDYQVCVVGVTDSQVHDLLEKRSLVQAAGHVTDAATLAAHIAVLKAAEKFDLRRIITFHRLVKRARFFAENIRELASLLRDGHAPTTIDAEWVSGEMSSGARNVRMTAFRGPPTEADLTVTRILANSRCLTEGVDIPVVDGIAFIDPRRSLVDVVQAVGRALRLHSTKNVGTIIVPIFIPSGLDNQPDMEETKWDVIWEVLNALRAHDDLLADELDALRRQLGRDAGGLRLPSNVFLDLPVEIGPDFADALTIRLIETGSDKWQANYGRLQEFKTVNGHARVAQSFKAADGFGLGQWVSDCRRRRIAQTLSSEQLQLLDDLGFVWDPVNEDWDRGLAHLETFIDTHGNALVSARYATEDGFPLGAWVSSRRNDLKAKRLSPEHIQKLDDLSFVWDPQNEDWERGFARLVAFKAERGHVRVAQSLKTEDGFLLGSWVARRRSDRKSGRLPAERIQQLDDLSFAWSAFDVRWQRGVDCFAAFKAASGQVSVPRSYKAEDGFPLGHWASNCRKERSSGKLRSDRTQQLDALGFLWDQNDDAWGRGLASLRAYAVTHHDLQVPVNYKASDGFALGQWAANRRREYNAGNLNPERMRELDDLGFVRDQRDDGWDRGLAHLDAFKAAHGHTQVPTEHKAEDGFALGSWVQYRRSDFKMEKLSPSRVQQLDALGFVWDQRDEAWDRGVVHLRAFGNEQGNLRVPDDHLSSDGFPLGQWVGVRRREYRNDKLSPRDEAWELALAHLETYKAVHGNIRIPQATLTSDGFAIGSWVATRRLEHKAGRLSPERVQQLDALGFVWDQIADDWTRAVSALRAFVAEHGHALVTRSYKTDDGSALGQWVNNRRGDRRAGKLSPERIQQLDALGFVWETK